MMNPQLTFTFSVWTPARSAPGWTRGMPPPNRPLLISTQTTTRKSPIAALSEGHRVRPVSSSQPKEPTILSHPIDDETATVASYLSDQSTERVPGAIDALVNALDDSQDESRCRAEIISHSNEQTRSVHAGDRVRGGRKTKAILDAIQTPVVLSSTFTFRSTQDCIDYNLGLYESFEYGRYGNPTTRAVEEKIMALDYAEDCLLSTSGMNAVTTMMLALVPENGHIVVTTDCYRRTRQFVNTLLPKMGIRTTILDPADLEGLKNVFETKGASLYFSESPTNPMIRLVDVPKISQLCQRYGVLSVIDTTFATPINFRPMEFGADLVLHSGTKYLAGHHDVMCGALAGRKDLVEKVRKLHGVLGGVVDPHAAFLINRGIKTLGVRMEAHNRNAKMIANYLSTHPKVSRVHFPTLSSHPDYDVGQRLFNRGFGGVLSFELKGDGNPWSKETFQATGRFVDGLKIAYIGPSLGGCETLVEQVCIMGYFDQPLKERKRLNINNGLIRLACGIEDSNDLLEDIETALELA